MKAIFVSSFDQRDRRGWVTAEVSDEQLFAHFLRVQNAFRSLVRGQDIDLVA